MKRLLRITVFTLALLASAAAVLGQTVVQNVPQSVQMQVFNAVNTAQCANVTQNVGQNVHMVTYQVTASATVRLRLEASNDGTNFFPISNDDASLLTAGVGSDNEGAVYGFGYFPVLRVCLLEFTTTAAATLTAHYAGTSSTQTPTGQFNPSQPYMRMLATQAAASSTQTFFLYPPFANAASFVIFEPSAALPAGTCTLGVTGFYGTNSAGVNLMATTQLATTGKQVFFLPPQPITTMLVTFTNCGATAVTFSLGLFFLEPTLQTVATSSSATPGGGVVPGISEAAFHCPLSAVITIAGAGTIKPIAEAAGQTIRICHVSVSFAGATNVQFVTGTGATCGTGTVNLTGDYQAVTALALDFDSGGLRTPASVGLCITTSAAVAGGGVVTFARF